MCTEYGTYVICARDTLRCSYRYELPIKFEARDTNSDSLLSETLNLPIYQRYGLLHVI